MMANEVATRQRADVIRSADNLKSLLETPKFKSALAHVLPKHLTPDRMAKMAIIASTKNPKLLQCTSMSVLKSVMDAASYGLDCSGLGGRGYLVPFANNKAGTVEAQFIPGYRGLMDVARRSRMVTNIWRGVVYACDEFTYDKGENTLHHIEKEGDRSDRKVIGAYARALLKGSEKPETIYLTRAEIERHRARSKAKDNGPWVTDYAAMCSKTALLALCRDLPQSSEMLQLIEHDNEAIDVLHTMTHETDANDDLVAKLLGEPGGGPWDVAHAAPPVELPEKAAEGQQAPPEAPDTTAAPPPPQVKPEAKVDKPKKQKLAFVGKPKREFDPQACTEADCPNAISGENGEITTHIDCGAMQTCKLEK